jgi:formate hydrogenlyase subunit 4
MTRTKWVSALTLYVLVSVLAAIFLKAQVAPCFGVVPTGQMSAECLAAWQAQRPWWDTMFDTPLGAVALFFALTAGTWVAVGLARRLRQRA